jgi:hypothetical protein
MLLTGPGGSAHLERLLGSHETALVIGDSDAWRTWAEEVLISWAACLLEDLALAVAAVSALSTRDHLAGLEYRSGASPRRMPKIGTQRRCCAVRTCSPTCTARSFWPVWNQPPSTLTRKCW